MKFIVGAYATSPCLYSWNKELETEYYRKLFAALEFQLVEHPYWGDLHTDDIKWFYDEVLSRRDVVITCVPGTMKHLKDDVNFGLASGNEDSRLNAVNFIKKVNGDVRQINSRFGYNKVFGVELHSAPNRFNATVDSSAEQFYRSIREIVCWNWSGSQILIEHCDEYKIGTVPEKGFLGIDDEIEVITRINTELNSNVGMVINWGRSAIEGKSTDTPIEHINKTDQAHILKGIVFSGCTDKEGPYGIWKDTHMPPPQELGNIYYADNSLMTLERIRNSIYSAKNSKLLFIGFKILEMSAEAAIDRRVGLNNDSFGIINYALNNPPASIPAYD